MEQQQNPMEQPHKIESYQEINSRTIDRWIEEGWEWGQPISHEVYEKALHGEWSVVLTPTKPVPKHWLGDLRKKRILGLASGGGQQGPVFHAAGAEVTILDYSEKQLETERMVASREGYEVATVRADMTKPWPFPDESFDLIFFPVANCYIESMEPVYTEAYRVLKPGGRLLSGLDNGFNFLFDEEDESRLSGYLPFNPLKNPSQMEELLAGDYGVQFSHSINDLVGGQIRAGFRLLDIYDDTNGSGLLHEHGAPCFYATISLKD